MRAALILMLIGTLAATACTRRTETEAALPYRASLKAQADGLLLIAVKAQGATLDMVRESARYQVTRHCLANRGNSAADWDIDPATGDWAHAVDGSGDMIFRARCRA